MDKIRYTPDIIDYVKRHNNNYISNDEIAELVNMNFNIKTNGYKIRKMKEYHMLSKYKKQNTKEIVDYIMDISEDKFNQEIADLVNQKFDTNLDYVGIRNIKTINKIKSNKKGKMISQESPIGSEYDSKGGNVYVKVRSPDIWMTKQRYIYEKHRGKIPAGYKVMFLNQNTRDYSIENLYLIKQSDLSMLIGYKLLSKNKDITKLGLEVISLKKKIIERS